MFGQILQRCIVWSSDGSNFGLREPPIFCIEKPIPVSGHAHDVCGLDLKQLHNEHLQSLLAFLREGSE